MNSRSVKSGSTYWMEQDHWLRVDMLQAVRNVFDGVKRFERQKIRWSSFANTSSLESQPVEIDAGSGNMLLIYNPMACSTASSVI